VEILSFENNGRALNDPLMSLLIIVVFRGISIFSAYLEVVLGLYDE
jgi:hypothetical protein